MRVSLVAIVVCGTACATTPAPSLQAMPPPVGTITQSVVLIGDAGAPSVDGDPVLQHLRRWLEAANHDTTVVFLGDNIYPDGLPPRDARGF
ncbi:MAG: hypothetical protein AB7L71_19500, partial [Vicinamibacterales bacterium]